MKSKALAEQMVTDEVCNVGDDVADDKEQAVADEDQDCKNHHCIPDDDVRRDPDSGKIWRFKDFREHFEGSYSVSDVHLYWVVACHSATWCGDVSQYVINLISKVITNESSNLQQEGSFTCSDSDFDSSDIDAAEEGLDPEDASVLTFGDVLDQYNGQYTEKDLRSWWRSNCRIGCDLDRDPVSLAEDGVYAGNESHVAQEFPACAEASSDCVPY